ncbi:nuclear transport factor 2 family protein [Rhodobacteraceae bacterium N5(2021)]|uniref:Nuclear transport factor 2 family protein n=1 Tax=Gymnodinialimonas phycosphaerae TaxID=2841589 RepID=A0A975TR94_9RHOB|nr:nuclear transport factor 2 family protein [Gymnodinialimonas phycosphaerae]MBY4893551.1 nuclear transport factor 2 family protein [Gymnodinialimonas phycosphaerae]
MPDFQTEKALVRAYHDAICKAPVGEESETLARFTSPDWYWRGMHPFHERTGAEAVADVYWTPLKTAFTRLQRRPDIFLAGRNEMDGFNSVWVVSMGHLMGLFDRPWLGIRPTGRITMLRYAEFNKVEDGRITETAMFCDIPQVMMQAGQNPFPPQTGAHLVQPGPMTHEGLMWDAQDPATGEATLAAINAMLNNPGEKFNDPDEARRLARVWQDDMIWWGPAGIGAAYTIPGYIRQHVEPFDAALFDGYRFNGHLCRVAEGHFGGFFGWANLTIKNSGGYMGMPAGPGPADMRVVDMYREEDGKLAENWIFIDLLHWLNMQGLDVLGRMDSL